MKACSIRRALDVIGDKPTLLILEAYWLGDRRFTGFVKRTGLLRTVVSARLQKLVAAGCMEKSLYCDRPRRYEYRGTEKLHSVYPVALSMLNWERKWAVDPKKLDVTLTCRHCNQTTSPEPACSACHEGFTINDVQWREGSAGLHEDLYQRRRRGSSNRDRKLNTELFDTVAGIVGDRWSVLVLKSLFTGHRSFLALQQDTQIASNILSDRLNSLLGLGLIGKDSASRSGYHLKLKGYDLYPTLLTLMAWGDRWYSNSAAPPVALLHKRCQQLMVPVMICSECSLETGFRDIVFRLDA